MKSSDEKEYQLYVITHHTYERKVDFYDINLKGAEP